jgi:predicted ATP-binding protein involved in virulence
MLIKAEVTGLFDQFDHEIYFEPEWEFVIAFGLNGVGKTRFLELINASINTDISKLTHVEFQKLTLTADSGKYVTVEKTLMDGPKGEPSDDDTVTYKLFDKKNKRLGLSWEASGELDPDLVRFLINNTTWTRMDGDYWQDSRDGEILHINELTQQYRLPDRLSSVPRKREPLPAELIDFIDENPTYLIETQRLGFPTAPRSAAARRRSAIDARSEASPKWTVDLYSHDLKRRIERALAQNSIESQRLDRTFPARIMNQSVSDADSEEEIRARHEEQNEQRTKLSVIGLTGEESDLPLPSKELEDWQRAVLTTYLNDNATKLSTFDELLDKITLLEALINRRFLRKRIEVSADDGLQVISTTRGTVIPPTGLSSGEQHELVLMYNLLFRVKPGTLVLIDEPEISLHVSWQMSFLDDVVRIAHSSGFRFIIATHSPQIIDKWWSRTVQLGPTEEEENASVPER